MPDAASTPVLPQPRAPIISPESHPYELNLGDYWRIIVKRRVIVFLTFVCVFVSTLIYTHMQPSLYQAGSAVRILESTRVFQAEGMYIPHLADPMASYAHQLAGEEVMQRVVIRLGLLPPAATAQELAAKAGELRGAIMAKEVGTTDIIQINVVYPNAQLAASIANQTAAVFVEVDLLEKTRQARSLRRFIEKQLVIFSDKLQSTEEKIRGFRQTGRALGIAAGMEQRLNDLEKERTVLLKQFTDRHPDVIKIDDQIEGIHERIQKLPADELELARLQRELELSDRAYRMMKEKLEAARLSEAEQVSGIMVVETATVPRMPISPKKNLNKLLGSVVGIILGVIFAFGLESLDTSIGTIEDVERTIKLVVVSVIPYFNPKGETAAWWRLDKWFMDLLGRRMDVSADSSYLIMNQDSLSILSEAYRILRTFIEFLLDKQIPGGRLLMITSTGPQEGKTLTACNLAISFAQAGKKTLLIDTDMRRPMVHRLFGLKRASGLSDILLGTTTLAEGKKTMGDMLVGEGTSWDKMVASKMLDRLEILTSGTRTPTPAELLASDAMKGLMDQCRIQYDYVILDTPPVLPVTDARTLGIMADACFFVYRAGKTARRAMTRAKKELEFAGVNVRGIILNHATPEVTLTDPYYYSYDYKARGEEKT